MYIWGCTCGGGVEEARLQLLWPSFQFTLQKTRFNVKPDVSRLDRLKLHTTFRYGPEVFLLMKLTAMDKYSFGEALKRAFRLRTVFVCCLDVHVTLIICAFAIRIFSCPWFYFSFLRSINILCADMVQAAALAH
jgi:hypothetical protein